MDAKSVNERLIAVVEQKSAMDYVSSMAMEPRDDVASIMTERNVIRLWRVAQQIAAEVRHGK